MKFEHGQLYNCEDHDGREIWIFESGSEVSSGLPKTVIGMLDKLGNDGWELVGLTSHSNKVFNSGFKYLYVFKRPKTRDG
ncbi:MAG: DUF4177 domain-containing protein [Defluviitaleaceae bacterium]|nr:DUF4177 domain-containing protein [Defluviitaleaceae bacterium]